MNDTAKRAVIEALADIAPDVDPSRVDDDLHEDLGLDSMDLLNLAAAVSHATGVAIPERDYDKVTTIGELIAYVSGGIDARDRVPSGRLDQ